jgi:branched-chain amino acid transport system substrate-binding protein
MFPDGQRFLRTIPSDSLQGVAMAELVERAGVDSAAVLAPDDAFGRAYTDAIAAALARRGITVTAQLAYDGTSDESMAAAIETALAGNPGAVALVGNTSTGRAALSTVVSVVPAGVPVVVNDTLRVAPDDEAVPTGDVDVIGGSPRPGPAPGSSWFTSTLATFLGVAAEDVPPSFAAHAYDCVSLLAIAAEASGANSAASLLARVSDISQGGATCVNFVTCRALLFEGRNIDLNGASGPLDLEANGDVSSGWFDRFQLDEEGHDVTTGELLVSTF